MKQNLNGSRDADIISDAHLKIERASLKTFRAWNDVLNASTHVRQLVKLRICILSRDRLPLVHRASQFG